MFKDSCIFRRAFVANLVESFVGPFSLVDKGGDKDPTRMVSSRLSDQCPVEFLPRGMQRPRFRFDN